MKILNKILLLLLFIIGVIACQNEANENHNLFIFENTSFTVTEYDSQIGVVSVTINGDLSSSDIEYSIVENDADLFELKDNYFNGIGKLLFVKEGKSLDYETNKTHKIIIEATVDDFKQQASIEILVTDIEEGELPVIKNQTLLVKEDLNDFNFGDLLIGKIEATDAEGPVSYKILEDKDDLFEFDSHNDFNGKLYLKKGKFLDYETKTSHNILVQVKDLNNNIATATVTINVQNVSPEAVVTTLATNNTSIYTNIATDSQGRVYTTQGGGDFNIYRYSSDGSKTIFATMPNLIHVMKIASDDYIYVISYSKIYIISPSGNIISGPTSIWFSDASGVNTANTDIVSIVAPDTNRVKGRQGLILTSQYGSFYIDFSTGKVSGQGSWKEYGIGVGETALYTNSSEISTGHLNDDIYTSKFLTREFKRLSSGKSGYKDGKIQYAEFNRPLGIVTDNNGNVYIADSKNHVIRHYSNGNVSTLAGNGPDINGVSSGGYVDASGTSAQFSFPSKMAIAKNNGILYVLDGHAKRIRKINFQD